INRDGAILSSARFEVATIGSRVAKAIIAKIRRLPNLLQGASLASYYSERQAMTVARCCNQKYVLPDTQMADIQVFYTDVIIFRIVCSLHNSANVRLLQAQPFRPASLIGPEVRFRVGCRPDRG